MKMQFTDAKLVELVLAGETHHFNTLIERYKDATFSVALSRLRNRDDAMDVVQESFIRAYQKLDQLSTPAKFGSWLLRITRNLCINRIRQSKRDEKNYPQLEGEKTVEHKDNLHSVLQEALMKLSESNRETTILYYINGYSVKEISKFLEIPIGTVVRRLHDSRNKLQEEVIKMIKKTAPKADFVKSLTGISIYPRIEPEIEIRKLTPGKITIDFTEFTWLFIPLKCGAKESFGFYDYPERKLTGYQSSWIERRLANFFNKKAYVIHSAGYTEKEEFEGETVFYCGIENGMKVYLGRKVYDRAGKLELAETFMDKEWDGSEDEPAPIQLCTTNYWEWSSLTQCKTFGKERDCDGPWEVKVGAKCYKCLRIVEFTPMAQSSKHTDNIGVEGFIDISTGRTVLDRRYNGSSWTKEKVGKKWPTGTIEYLKECPKIECDGEQFYLWYDCIPAHVFK